MALHLNLLHEEILEHRQRQRDPLKIGVMVLVSFGVLMFLYYMWNAYRTLEIKGRLSVVEREWAKVEPTVTAAQKRSTELTNIIKTTRVLDEYVDEAVGHMEKNAEGKLAITRVTLKPKLKFSGDKQPTADELDKMHHGAHDQCFIASSVKTEVTVEK